MSKQQWSTNLTVRTQISAFLAGTFFAVLLVFATRQDTQSLVGRVDLHYVLTIMSLTLTFVAFAFSTFAFGLSGDFFRKGVEQKAKSASLEKRAKTALYVGGDFFKVGYFSMMWSLTFVLAYAHLLFGVFGLFVFIVSWAYLYIKTGPYEEKKREKEVQKQQ